MAVTTTRRLTRQRRGRLIAGVCVGLARTWRLDTAVVRFAFLALTLAGGVGVVAYLLAWAVLPVADDEPPVASTDLIDNIAVLVAVIGAVFVLRGLGLWFSDLIGIVGGMAAAGLALVWGRAEGPEELVHEGTRPLQIAVGVLLVVLGFVVFVVLTGDVATLGRTILGGLVLALGIVLLVGPRLARLAGDLSDERQARIRSEERADIAAHLHDGVLQTLALIQRRAGDEREVVALARQQERELRSWLYGGQSATEGSTLATVLRRELGAVEDAQRVSVELVIVGEGGDVGLDEAGQALVLALREAVTNAAVHAGVQQVDVYVEVRENSIDAFVRDRGRGFDLDAVAPDRRGLADSVVGRIERVGGRAVVRSEVGSGTEVELVVPRHAP